MRISFIDEVFMAMEIVDSEDIIVKEQDGYLLFQACKDDRVVKGMELDLTYHISFNGTLGASSMDIMHGISQALLNCDNVSIVINSDKMVANIKSTR